MEENMKLTVDKNRTRLTWEYGKDMVSIEKNSIIDAKDFEKEGLILVIFEMKNDDYPFLAGYNLDGTERFLFRSSDDLGVLRFTTQHGINIPIVGWIKENNEYTDYYFSVNSKDGSLTKYGRAY